MRNEASMKKCRFWIEEINDADKVRNRWLKRAQTIVERYRDERKTDDGVSDATRKMNLFWSNVETLKGALYAKIPQPIVERRFLDKDPTGRAAAMILERALRYEMPSSGFHHATQLSRDDYLLVGRGQIWVRYNPLFGESASIPARGDDEMTDENGKAIEGEREEEETQVTEELLSESICIDYVNWQDFYTSRARTWNEVEWVAKRAYMSRYDLTERFGEKKGKRVPLDHRPEGAPDTGSAASNAQSNLGGSQGDKATVYEIWCKYEKRVYFIAKEFDEVLEEMDDPLHLEGFFPCPRPIYATMTNDTLIPVPDYAETQDQYAQIDELTRRIDILSGACRVAGLYDASNVELRRVFEEAAEPQLIPVNQWAMYAEKGGLKNAIALVPIEEIARVLDILQDVRQRNIDDLDRVTGIWDIMRGTSDARETMGAQRLKQNNGSGRLRTRQEEVARFCRDTVCIMGEIIAEHFDPKTLIQVSGAMFDEGLIPSAPPPPPQPTAQPSHPLGQPPMGGGGPAPGPMAQQGQPPIPMPPQETPEQKEQRKMMMIAQAIQLLKDEKQRGFRIDIETDSTIEGDIQEEKAARTEFIQGVTVFIEKAGMVAAQLPEFAPLAGKMLQFGVRGFRVGRDLETAIDDFCEAAEKQAKEIAANPQAKENPEKIKQQTEMMKAQAEIERAKVEAESERNNAMINLESNKMDMEIEKIKLQMKQLDLQIHHRDTSIKALEHLTPPAEGGGGEGQAGVSEGSPAPAMHPNLALQQLTEIVGRMEKITGEMNKPKRVVVNRDKSGKASHYDVGTIN